MHAVAGSCLSLQESYWRSAVVRLAGIVLGVSLAQLASVALYSKTHSDSAIARLQTSLRSTSELCEAAWLAWHLTDKPHVPTFLAAPAEELKAALEQATKFQSCPPHERHAANTQAMQSWHGESIRTTDPPSPAASCMDQAASITGPRKGDSPVMRPEASPHTQLNAACGPGIGDHVLGILQVRLSAPCHPPRRHESMRHCGSLWV